MTPSPPSDASRIPSAHELQRRLDENPDQRLLVIQEFFAERVAAGDGEGAAWALTYRQLEQEKENAGIKHQAEIQKVKQDRMSPLLKLMIVLGFIAGVIFGLLGIWLVYLGASGATEVSFFGQTAKSTNVGIVAIFFGAVIIVLLMRSILKTIRSGL